MAMLKELMSSTAEKTPTPMGDAEDNVVTANVGAAMTIATDQPLPPRASFMGLAVEIRLQIYGYLLSPTLTNDDVAGLHAGAHCCSTACGSPFWPFSSGPKPIIMTEAKLVCPCAGSHLSPHILSASKQIFGEAMPMLYSNMAFHVEIERPPAIVAALDFEQFERLFCGRLPPYAQRHISRALVTGTVADALYEHSGYDGQEPSLIEQYCEKLRDKLPKLKHLWLHLEAGKDIEESRSFKPLQVIATLPELCDVTVCVHARQNRSVFLAQNQSPLSGNEISERFVEAVKQGAETAGRRILIRGI